MRVGVEEDHPAKATDADAGGNSVLVLGEDRNWFQVELYRPADLPEAQIDPAPFYVDHMIEGAIAHGMQRYFVARLQEWRNSLG